MMLRCTETYLAVDGPADKVLFIHRMKVQGSHKVCMPAPICIFYRATLHASYDACTAAQAGHAPCDTCRHE